jgi:DnaJ-class molecular chaperone
MRRDYYAVLGIAATADLREVRQAYRRLARRYSPDVNLWQAEARTLFEEISEAYRVLSDPHARSLYDRFGHVIGGRQMAAEGRRGDDLHVTVALSFAEAAQGATVTLDVSRYSRCEACDGAACAHCRGRGVRPRAEPVAVSIPAGMDTGAQVRVPGQGHAGPFDGPRGDLIVSTRVDTHPFFTRKGDNLYCEVPITLAEAILGARVAVPTLDGEATLVVPPGTQSGQAFRLRRWGVPHAFGDGIGDLYVTVRVEIPRDLDARTQEMVRDLDRLIAADLRAGLARYRKGAT